MKKFSDWLNARNQVFSLVKMALLIPLSLYDLSLQDFNHTCTLHIYICHTSHILWKNLQAYSIPHAVQSKKEHKNTMCSNLLVIVSQFNEFHTIPSQIFTTYNSLSIGSVNHFTASKGTNNNTIILFQKCDTFGSTEEGRTWLTSQDHPDYT